MRKLMAIVAIMGGLLMNMIGAEPLLDGATLIFPEGIKNNLNCIGILVTKNHKVIVFDGGGVKDLDPLLEHLKPYGNTVHHWFLSHAHRDHAGALCELVDRNNADLKIEKLYYDFPEQEFLIEHEPWGKEEVGYIFAHLPKMKFPYVKTCEGMVITEDGVTIEVLNSAFRVENGNAVNESSVVLRVSVGSKVILFTGDIGPVASGKLLKLCPEKLKADIVVMAHHGQNGATKEFYAAVAPSIAVWTAPMWLWENDNGNGVGSATLLTNYVKVWMQELGVRKNFVTAFGDVVIK